MRRLVNPAVLLLLRSPLWRLLPGVMVLTVFGRKSHRPYSTPVQFAEGTDGLIHVLTQRRRTWWRNVRGGANVELRLHGREMRGHADTTEPADEAAVPALAAFHGSSLERALGRAGSDAVIVTIRPREA